MFLTTIHIYINKPDEIGLIFKNKQIEKNKNLEVIRWEKEKDTMNQN